MDLYVRAVLCAQGHRAVEHELHVARAARLFGCKRDLLGDITCGDQFPCFCHIVVLYHDHLQIRAHLRVIVDDLLKAKDQMDDIFGDHVRGSSLCPEDRCHRR